MKYVLFKNVCQICLSTWLLAAMMFYLSYFTAKITWKRDIEFIKNLPEMPGEPAIELKESDLQ